MEDIWEDEETPSTTGLDSSSKDENANSHNDNGPSNESSNVLNTYDTGDVVVTEANANQESQQHGDIPRNTPPPDYNPENITHSGEESSKGKVGGAMTLAQPDNSFWLVGNYKKIVKKVDDGAKLCEELSQMMLERAEIESLYAKKLKAWNKKWSQSFSKGLEYGSALHSLVEGLEESNAIADIHSALQGKLFEVSQQIQAWKVENFHKGIIGLKETKKAEEGFTKAQKPWAKKYDDTIKGKQNYHSACQNLDLSRAQEAELRANKDNTTQDQIIKIENKVKKAVQDRENALEFYKESLRDIGNYNHKYKEDMIYEYEKWETSERKRKEFVIVKLKEFRDCVDVSLFQSRIEQIYSQMTEAYDSANTSTDLEWYRRSFGPDLPFIDISFIEYDPGAKSNNQAQGPIKDPDSNPKKSSKVCVAL